MQLTSQLSNEGCVTQQKTFICDTVLVPAWCDTGVFAVAYRYCSCCRCVSDCSEHVRISSVWAAKPWECVRCIRTVLRIWFRYVGLQVLYLTNCNSKDTEDQYHVTREFELCDGGYNWWVCSLSLLGLKYWCSLVPSPLLDPRGVCRQCLVVQCLGSGVWLKRHLATACSTCRNLLHNWWWCPPCHLRFWRRDWNGHGGKYFQLTFCAASQLA